MARVLQDLITKADEELLSMAIKLIDNFMDNDFHEIYHQIIECGTSAYGAAKVVFESGKSARSMKTLNYHAQQIEVNLIEFLGQITPESVFEELKRVGEVECPDELISDFEKLVKANDVPIEKWVTYSLIPSKKGREL